MLKYAKQNTCELYFEIWSFEVFENIHNSNLDRKGKKKRLELPRPVGR